MQSRQCHSLPSSHILETLRPADEYGLERAILITLLLRSVCHVLEQSSRYTGPYATVFQTSVMSPPCAACCSKLSVFSAPSASFKELADASPAFFLSPSFILCSSFKTKKKKTKQRAVHRAAHRVRRKDSVPALRPGGRRQFEVQGALQQRLRDHLHGQHVERGARAVRGRKVVHCRADCSRGNPSR